MKIAIVKAVSRDGYNGYWSAGRMWPSGSPRIIEISDEEEDPVAPLGSHINQDAIGQKSLRQLEAEGFLSVNLREIDSLADIELVGNTVQIKRKSASAEKTSGTVAIKEDAPAPVEKKRR